MKPMRLLFAALAFAGGVHSAAAEIRKPFAAPSLSQGTDATLNSLQILSPGSTGPVDGMTVGGRALSDITDGLPVDLAGRASANLAAIAAVGKPWMVPANSNVVLPVAAGQRVTSLNEAVNAISRWFIPSNSTVTLQLPAGKSVNPTLVWTHPYGDRIAIAGQNSTNLTPTSFVGATGTRNNWQTTIQFASAGGAAVGDYVLAWNTAGTGNHEVLRGVYPVTAVSGNQITLRNTGWYSSFPTPLTLTGGGFVLLKTVLRFEGVDGFVIKGSRLGSLRNVVLEGNADEYWSEADVAGTEKGTHGIIVGSPTLLSSNPSSNLQQAGNPLGVGASSVSLGLYVGVFGFDQQGIASAMGSSTFANFSASSNNRRRGYYADSSSAIWAKNLSAGGNFLDGVISDNSSNVIASSNSALVGNGGKGAFAQLGSSLDVGTAKIVANVGGGARSQNNSMYQASGAYYEAGGILGVNAIEAQTGGAAVIDSSNINGFALGVSATTGSSIRALNTLTINNSTTSAVKAETGSAVSIGALAGTGNAVEVQSFDFSNVVINGVSMPTAWSADTAGLVNLRLLNGANNANLTLSGIGDLAWSVNGVGLATMKAGSGTLFPNTTSATLGRTAERWVNVFATKASFSVASLSAAGGGQAGATRLDSTYTDVTTVAAGAGVRLNYAVGERQEIWNSGANALSVYPPAGAQIGTSAANAAVSIPAGGRAAFVAISATQWRQGP